MMPLSTETDMRYSAFPQEIVAGPDALSRLGVLLESFPARRCLLIASRSQRRHGTLARLSELLGGRLVAVYDHVEAHVPAEQVEEVLALARQSSIETLLALGGGSVLGMAKAVSHALQQGPPATTLALTAPMPAVGASFPIVAVPTTYAGSKMTPVYGVTRRSVEGSRKITVTDPRIVPRLVIYDPLLTLTLPRLVTAGSGVNALAHCIEALYSLSANPLSSALALEGIRLIVEALPRCVLAGDDLQARSELLYGAWLAGSALAHVKLALHHGLCHVLGGSAGLAHGSANAIVLPHAMRFNLESAREPLARAAEALGVVAAGRPVSAVAAAGIERVEALIATLGLPRRLREVGVREEDLPTLARLAFENRTVQQNPRAIVHVEQLEALLRAAW